MKVYAETQQGNLRLTPSQFKLRKNYLKSLKDGTRVTDEIKVVREGKTHQQVKTIFGLAIQTILDQFEERGLGMDELLGLEIPNGNPVTKGFLKEYCYAVCPMYSEDDKRITLSHKDCTTKCASEFFDAIRNHFASQWSVYIQEPRIDWRDNEQNTPND